jgi:hypothetical protein
VRITLNVVLFEELGYVRSLRNPEFISVEKVAIPTGWLIVPYSAIYVVDPS